MNHQKEFIRKYLEMFKQFESHSGRQLLQLEYLRRGKTFSGEPLSPVELDELGSLLAGVPAFKMGMCYMNASQIALEFELPYCEGVASGVFPVEHAWNSFHGRPIDLTWGVNFKDKPTKDIKKILTRIQYNVKHNAYFGIEFGQSILREVLLDTKRYGQIANHRLAETRIVEHGELKCLQQSK